MALGGCASLPFGFGKPPAVAPVELTGVPFVAQTEYQCGPAAMAMALDFSGVPADLDTLTTQVYLPDREGSLQAEMLAVPAAYGRLGVALPPDPDALVAELHAGRPVIVLQNLGLDGWPVWHYSVLIGVDPARETAVLRYGDIRRYTQSWDTFMRTWVRGGAWAMTVLEPGRMSAQVSRPAYLRAAAALERAARPEAAEAAYETALRRWPDSLKAAVGLANARYARNDLAGTEAALRDAAGRHPRSIAVLNNLAQVLLDRGCYREAASLAHRARALAPEPLPALADTLRQVVAVADRAGGPACAVGGPA